LIQTRNHVFESEIRLTSPVKPTWPSCPSRCEPVPGCGTQVQFFVVEQEFQGPVQVFERVLGDAHRLVGSYPTEPPGAKASPSQTRAGRTVRGPDQQLSRPMAPESMIYIGSTEVPANTLGAFVAALASTSWIRHSTIPAFGLVSAALLPFVPDLSLYNGLLQVVGTSPETANPSEGGSTLLVALRVALGIAAPPSGPTSDARSQTSFARSQRGPDDGDPACRRTLMTLRVVAHACATTGSPPAIGQ
jgi:Threonine/Serine exporter, ThrE